MDSLKFSRSIYIIYKTLVAFYFYTSPFFFFSSCLTAMASTSRTMLSNTGDSGCPCLVPDVDRNLEVFYISVRDTFVFTFTCLPIRKDSIYFLHITISL